MKAKWNEKSAKAYIEKCDKNPSLKGLTYCSALDYVSNHSSPLKSEKPDGKEVENER